MNGKARRQATRKRKRAMTVTRKINRKEQAKLIKMHNKFQHRTRHMYNTSKLYGPPHSMHEDEKTVNLKLVIILAVIFAFLVCTVVATNAKVLEII